MNEIKRGSVWLCNFPVVKGTCMQIGNRPCLIVSNDLCNKHSPTITVAPMTTKPKPPQLTHFRVKISDVSSIILFEQVQTIDKAQVISYIDDLTPDQMFYCDHCLKIQLGLT